MAQVNIKQLSINDEIVNVYLYIIEDKNQIMLAIPDIFWSIELDLNMDSNDVKKIGNAIICFYRKMKQQNCFEFNKLDCE